MVDYDSGYDTDDDDYDAVPFPFPDQGIGGGLLLHKKGLMNTFLPTHLHREENINVEGGGFKLGAWTKQLKQVGETTKNLGKIFGGIGSKGTELEKKLNNPNPNSLIKKTVRMIARHMRKERGGSLTGGSLMGLVNLKREARDKYNLEFQTYNRVFDFTNLGTDNDNDRNWKRNFYRRGNQTLTNNERERLRRYLRDIANQPGVIQPVPPPPS